MSNDRVRLTELPRAVVGEISEENLTFMAGSIAYSAFVSLLPLLILAFVFLTVVGDEQLATRAITATEGFLPNSAQQLLGDAITGADGGAAVSIIGAVTLGWGALKIFRGLDTAFSSIFDTEGRNSLVDQLRDGVVVFVALIVAIGAAIGAGGAFAAFELPYVGLLSPLLLVVVLTVAFFPMFYLFPDVDLPIRHVLPGTLFAAVGWTALEALFQVYVAFADKSDAYGVLGAVLLLVTWLYFSGLVLLVGATINAVLAGRTGEGEIDEKFDADPATAADRTAARIEETVAQRERRELERKRAALKRRTVELRRDCDRLAEENRTLRRRLERRDQPVWRRLSRRLLGN
jgi:membrane protein